ncbi:hypothetical protein SVI_0072 [Shewanella violacea DSS12]|uniref:Coproporphyrinogen III oxidase n=1 Tax=Shewanella violacea (strain JCM 10179 / CIP 106290 / LMG 19151 / DSS12) TaxID=637905 RepID=D4ZDC1_SHEVD|nr:hypothetical protein SVI_0072 [Shewanella violacea DSS12]
MAQALTETYAYATLPRNQVRWEYMYTLEAGSPEALLYTDFLKPRDWLGLNK